MQSESPIATVNVNVIWTVTSNVRALVANTYVSSSRIRSYLTPMCVVGVRELDLKTHCLP